MTRLRSVARGALLAAIGLYLAPAAGAAQSEAPRVLDDFETVAGWTAAPADGVRLRIGTDTGHAGRAMRLDFDFQGHGGYAVARKRFPIDLPDNYAFTFWIRADAPVNNLEFKLVDSTGDNVWWMNRRNLAFPRGWTSSPPAGARSSLPGDRSAAASRITSPRSSSPSRRAPAGRGRSGSTSSSSSPGHPTGPTIWSPRSRRREASPATPRRSRWTGTRSRPGEAGPHLARH
jgi:hypothetical protein